MTFIYSILKSYKLRKLSKILSITGDSVDDILSISLNSKKKDKAEEDLYNFCLNDKFIKRELEHHNVGKKELKELYLSLLLNGAAQWAGGHYVLVSIFFYNPTLDYCLSREKLGVSVERMVIRCLDYFANGETGLIIPHWNQK